MSDSLRKILAVDDNDINVAIFEHILSERYHLETAMTGADAVSLAHRFHPDLVLLDIMMPDMDGYEVCRALRESPTLAAVKVVMVSARAMSSETRLGVEAGADAYLTKPFTDEELIEIIESCLKPFYV